MLHRRRCRTWSDTTVESVTRAPGRDVLKCTVLENGTWLARSTLPRKIANKGLDGRQRQVAEGVDDRGRPCRARMQGRCASPRHIAGPRGWAASRPQRESSIAMHDAGSTASGNRSFSLAIASRYRSGAGLPRTPSDAEAIAANELRKPACSRTISISGSSAPDATASGTCSANIFTHAAAPGNRIAVARQHLFDDA